MPINYVTTTHIDQIKNWDQHLELRLDKLNLSIHEIIAITKKLKHTPIISDRNTFIQNDVFKAICPFGMIDIDLAQYNSNTHQGLHPLILSSHETSYPNQLPDIPQHYFKICPEPKSMIDCLRFLVSAQSYKTSRTISYARGTKAIFTRLLAQRSHQPIHFTAHDKASAQDGQLIENPAQNLIPAKYWLAVIGHLIEHSQSPKFHNQWINHEKLPAHYVKLDISPNEIEDCIPLIKALPFIGLSITSPYKQLFAKHFNATSPVINTLVNHHTFWSTYNTDQDAFMALTQPANQILILGSGACALAIAEKIKKPVDLWARSGKSREYFLKRFPNTRPHKKVIYDLIISTLPAKAHTHLPKLTSDVLLDLQYQSLPPKQIQYQKLIPGDLFFLTQAKLQKNYFKTAIIKEEM